MREGEALDDQGALDDKTSQVQTDGGISGIEHADYKEEQRSIYDRRDAGYAMGAVGLIGASYGLWRLLAAADTSGAVA